MEDFFIAAGIVVLVFIPALALTARFALRPIVEAIIRLREGLIGDSTGSVPADRLAAIEGELAEIRRDIRKLAEVSEFNRDLASATDRDKFLPGAERLSQRE
jgi:hypothetical protein